VIEGGGLPFLADRWASTQQVELVACHIATDVPTRCPALRGDPCPLAAGADAVIVRADDRSRAEALLASHRRGRPHLLCCSSAAPGDQDVVAGSVAIGPIDEDGLARVVDLVRRRPDHSP